MAPYNRHYLSAVCYSRGNTWIPHAMLERMITTANILLLAALKDMRQLSPELQLLETLPDNHKNTWMEIFCGSKNSPLYRTIVAYGRLTTDHHAILPPLEMELEADFLKIRQALDEEEDEYIQTYKVGRKKAELDRLVQRSMKRFSLSGV